MVSQEFKGLLSKNSSENFSQQKFFQKCKNLFLTSFCPKLGKKTLLRKWALNNVFVEYKFLATYKKSEKI